MRGFCSKTVSKEPPGDENNSRMKKVLLYGGGLLLLAGAGFGAYAAFQQPTTPEGTRLTGMDLGGLGESELRQRLESWWAAHKSKTLSPTSHLLSKQPSPQTLEELGVRPDWDATLASIRFDSYAEKLIGNGTRGSDIKVVWRLDQSQFQDLKTFVERNARRPVPARVSFANGTIKREPEVTTFALDESRVGEAALDALSVGKETFDLPVKAEKPRITAEQLNLITDVVSEFKTNFNRGQINRSSNIRLAASKLNGVILLPGEVLSYNETVGKRTVANGFKLAGVYANGRHDVGIGGGICQVSTTLYNAALLANLEIVQRSNHSMPVPYVPFGRDATVDYASIDLKFRNSSATPIAVVSEVNGGTITFRVLGKKDTTKNVKIVSTDHSSWGNGIKYVSDPTVPAGKTKVVEKGSIGRRCVTWRILEENGVEVGRENLGVSYYKAVPRIIARGPAPKPAAETPAPDGLPPAEGGADGDG